jgi:hypothetical protein
MLGAERLLSDRQRALCNWNGLQVLPRYVRYFARLVARRRGGTQPASGGFSWIGKAQGFRMPINPPEIVVLVHRLLLDPMIVSITICLVFVAGFIFGYGGEPTSRISVIAAIGRDCKLGRRSMRV